MPDHPMTPDEMVNFEEEVVQHGDEQHDVAAPASESDALPRDDRSTPRPLADIAPTPD